MKGQVIKMQYFTSSIEDMVRTYAGDFEEDFDIDAIVDEYLDQFNTQIEDGMCSLHRDGSITDWDWANNHGWDERHIYTDDELDEIRDSIDLDDLMATHDDTAA